MAYGVRAFPTDHYDRKCEHVRSFRELRDMWLWVFEYLSAGNRKVVVYRRTERHRWHGMRRTTVRKIAELTEPEEVPVEFQVSCSRGET